MIGWLKSLFKKEPAPPSPSASLDLYEPRERCIYRYYDGEKVRWVDPMVLYKRMLARQMVIYHDVKVAFSPSKDAAKAYDSLVRTAREIFDVEAFKDDGKNGDGRRTKGLTEVEAVELLAAFTVYIEDVKKNSSLFEIPAPTLAPTEPSSDGGPTTPNSGDSTSARSEPSTATPPPSPSEPESPSAP